MSVRCRDCWVARQEARRRSRGCVDWRVVSGVDVTVVEVVIVEAREEGSVLRARRVSGRPGAEGAESVAEAVVLCVDACVGSGARRRVFVDDCD